MDLFLEPIHVSAGGKGGGQARREWGKAGERRERGEGKEEEREGWERRDRERAQKNDRQGAKVSWS